MRVLSAQVDGIIRRARRRADRDPEFREDLLHDGPAAISELAGKASAEFADLHFVEEGESSSAASPIQVELPPASFLAAKSEAELESYLEKRRAELLL